MYCSIQLVTIAALFVVCGGLHLLEEEKASSNDSTETDRKVKTTNFVDHQDYIVGIILLALNATLTLIRICFGVFLKYLQITRNCFEHIMYNFVDKNTVDMSESDALRIKVNYPLFLVF